MRYGVAIARGKLYEPGTYTIKRKVRWPHWQPTQNMIDRDPELYADIADGMEPGPENALGSRALRAVLDREASAAERVPAASEWSWYTSMISIPTSRLARRHSCTRRKTASPREVDWRIMCYAWA